LKQTAPPGIPTLHSVQQPHVEHSSLASTDAAQRLHRAISPQGTVWDKAEIAVGMAYLSMGFVTELVAFS
jgi:hypothetical protein